MTHAVNIRGVTRRNGPNDSRPTWEVLRCRLKKRRGEEPIFGDFILMRWTPETGSSQDQLDVLRSRVAWLRS
jgi:hypothetical protein